MKIIKRALKISPVAIALFIVACGGGDETLEAKKLRLQQLEKQYEQTGEEIKKLQKEIAKLDPDAEKVDEGKLVSVVDVEVEPFSHVIEIQGTVQSEENITLSSDVGGTVEGIRVSEGQKVERGDVLLKLDDETIRRNIAEIQTNLDLATSLYLKQENLWKQGIGSEVQYLEAKSRMESLQKRLQTARTQLAKTTLRSPINGTVDKIFIKLGELAAPGMPLVRVVNLDDVKVDAAASEAYVGTIQKGDSVTVSFPSLGTERMAQVTAVGQVINPSNRTFEVEAALSNQEHILKPNLLAVIEIKDYENADAVVVPTRYIQHADRGEYVFIAKEEDGVTRATKVMVETGRSYSGETEILKGLKGGELLIAGGFRDVIDGEQIRVKEEREQNL